MNAVADALRNAGVALEDAWDEIPELSETDKSAMLENILSLLDTLWDIEKQRSHGAE